MSISKIEKRQLDGVVLIDKPIGMTSNAVLQKVKTLFKARKAGHTGSLDPLATGMLPICFGEATKFSQYLLNADKCYQVAAALGTTTNSGDVTGEIVEQKLDLVPGITESQIQELLPQFTGEITQVPPMFSALKHQGRPLYELARKGIEVERKARTVTIFKLELLSFEDGLLQMFVHCSKGTYIRTLVEDIGQALGCGAHVTALRRTQVGDFKSDEMYEFDNIATTAKQDFPALQNCLLPIDCLLQHFEVIELNSRAVTQVRHGQTIYLGGTTKPGLVRIQDEARKFIGMGEYLDDGRLAPRRMTRMDGAA